MTFKSLGLLTVLFLSISSAHVWANECDKSLMSFDISKRVGTRGFLASNPGLDDARAYDLSAEGFIGWTLSAYVRPSVEAAKAHHDLIESNEILDRKKAKLAEFEATEDFVMIEDPQVLEAISAKIKEAKQEIEDDEKKIKMMKDPIMKPMYIIGELPEEYEQLQITDQMSDKEKADVVSKKRAIYANLFRNSRLIHFSRHTGQPVDVTDEQRSFFDTSKAIPFSPDILGHRIGNPGWVFPEVRGVLPIEKSLSGSTYKNLRNQARKLQTEGHRFVFNEDFIASLNMTRDQDRRGSSPEESRYKIPAVYNKSLEFYKEGKAFSVEIRDKNNKLKGGLLCFRYGNLVTIDTVFYDRKNPADLESRPDISYAKVAVLALMDRLKAVGITFIDMGMVTSYSDTLKAFYMESDEFLALVAKTPKGYIEIDVTGEWTPPAAGQK